MHDETVKYRYFNNNSHQQPSTFMFNRSVLLLLFPVCRAITVHMFHSVMATHLYFVTGIIKVIHLLDLNHLNQQLYIQ